MGLEKRFPVFRVSYRGTISNQSVVNALAQSVGAVEYTDIISAEG